MRFGARRMHADVRTLLVSGDSPGTSHAHRTGLRVGGERLRLPSQVLFERERSEHVDTETVNKFIGFTII